METKLNYALVGLFVIVLGGALVAAVIWLVVGTEKKVYDQYRLYVYESVSGLNPKAALKYRGVEVGRVASIKLDPLDPERVEVMLDIEQGTPIRQDTLATLQIQGLTGLAYLELSGGSRHSPALLPTPEVPVPVIGSAPSLVARLDNAFTTMLADFNSLSAKLGNLLGDDNQLAVQQILTHAATVTESVAAHSQNLEQTLIDLSTFTSRLAAHADTLGRAMDSAAKTLDNSVRVSAELAPMLGRISAGAEAVEEMAKTIITTSQGLTVAVEDSRQEVRRLAANTAPELNVLLVELSQLADTMRRFVLDLERNPRMFLLGRPSGKPGPGE